VNQVLQRLYDSEINCCLSSFWDGGWTVKLGDATNGFVAEANVGSLDEAAQWLHEQAHEHFPDSEYAQKYPLRG
jgi:hypothetical protein